MITLPRVFNGTLLRLEITNSIVNSLPTEKNGVEMKKALVGVAVMFGGILLMKRRWLDPWFDRMEAEYQPENGYYSATY